ncbi:ankyrin repeat domain-containing protein, partial [Planctomycetota bacterium]
KVKAFLEQGTDINAKDDQGMTPLLRAVSGKHTKVAEFLVEDGADVNTGDKWGYVPLVYALWNTDSDMVRLLLDKGADPNARDTPSGYTMLHWAVMMDSKESTELVLVAGANVNAKSKTGDTALDVAGYGASPAIRGLLLAKGAEISSLHAAAYVGDLSKVKAFIDEGVEINKKNDMGGTAMHSAAAGGHREVVEFLIGKGADIDAQNRRGQTPLHIVADGGHQDVVQLLLGRGAAVNVKDKRGRTPLDLAQEAKHSEIFDVLRRQSLVHDVAVTSIEISPSCVKGDIVPVVVTLNDRSATSESFETVLTDVTDRLEIGSQAVGFPSKYYSAADADLILTGENRGDYLSVAVVSQGDLNGDGFDDLLLTAPRYGSGNERCGRAYLYYGKSDLSSLSVDLILDSEDTSGQFGQDAFFGDVNGDGIDDMVTGDWRYNNSQGRVYLYYGKSGGITTKPDKIFEAESGLSNSEFGFRTVLGDVDNDGCADLAVYADNYGGNASGRVYLYYGAPGTSMDTTCDLVFDGDGGVFDSFGRSIIIGEDINGDGYGDLVIGSLGWGGEKGRAYIFLGDKRESMDTVCDLILTGENKGDRFTRYFDVGDINGDKIADMAIGASWRREHEGCVYIYYGHPELANLAVYDAKINGPTTYSAFGVGVLLADVTGDDVEDLIIGASGYPRGQQWGRVWLYYGGDRSFDMECDMIFDGESRKTNFGRYMDVGDLDNDGCPEIIVGAWAYPDFTAQGRAYVFRGEDRSLSRDTTFKWDTTNASIGRHTLRVEIPPVPGEQKTEDNTKTATIEVKEPRR